MFTKPIVGTYDEYDTAMLTMLFTFATLYEACWHVEKLTTLGLTVPTLIHFSIIPTTSTSTLLCFHTYEFLLLLRYYYIYDLTIYKTL